jgi:carboxylesterase
MANLDMTAENRSFNLERGRVGALLLHGLGGTPVEMRYVAMGLAHAGVSVSCPQLAGHSGSFDELRDSRWQDWLASAEAALDELRRRCDVVAVGGLSMGAVLALMLAAVRPKDVAGAAAYAPTLRLDGWGVPWYAQLFQLVPHKAIANWFDFTEREPYGVKDPRVRALVAAAIESGDSSKAGMLTVPGGAMYEFRGLVNEVRRRARDIKQPVLLVHPREDDRANIANSFWLQRNLGGLVDMVVLDDSYHVMTMDRQRHIVTDRTIAFVESVGLGSKQPDAEPAAVVEMPSTASRTRGRAA